MCVLLIYFIFNIQPVFSRGLVINSTCVPFENVAYFPDTSGQLHEIGWIKVLSCSESIGSVNTFTIHRRDYMSLSSRAISVKIQPPEPTTNYENFTVVAKPYSSAIRYGLNLGQELSFSYNSDGSVYGFANTSHWLRSSTARARLVTVRIREPRPFHEQIYHVDNNRAGFYILPNRAGTRENPSYACL